MNDLIQKETPIVLILVAAPAAGKGTAGAFFREAGFDIISTGDMLREEAARGTELGLKAKEIMDRGGLVDDRLIIDVVRQRMLGANACGYVFDGFPRTAAQAEALDKMLAEEGADPGNIHAVRIDVNDCNLRTRVKKRYDDTIAAGKEPRRDDNPVAFEARLKAYGNYSREVSDYYGPRLIVVDGNANPQDTLHQILLTTGISLHPDNGAQAQAQKTLKAG